MTGAFAGIADTPLPQFSDGTPSSAVYLVSGVVKRASRLETLFMCTSLSPSPVHVGVEIFGPDGVLLNDVHAGVGAVLSVAPQATVTIATSATASYLESTVIPLAPVSQGSARVIASAVAIRCTVMIVDGAVSPPVSLASLLPGAALTSGPILPTRALPSFSDGTPATHAALIPGVIKRGPMETNIFCTSLASTPIDIGVEILAANGASLNSIGAGNGAALGVLPGHTVTFGTGGTAAFLEDVIVSISGVAQGLARVVASSAEVLCSATVADQTVMPPVALSEILTLGCRDAGTPAACDGSGSLPPALPTFSDGKPSVLVSEFSGVTKRMGVQTDFICSSAASTPVDIGVQVFDASGVLLNDVSAGVGALLNVSPGATVTFGTTGTNAYLESQVLAIAGVAQGYARVVASSSAVRCAAMLLDDSVTPPASLGTLAPAVHPIVGSQVAGIGLPTFSNSVAATHAALVTAVIKREPMQTVFFCTSRASAAVHIGVELFAPEGTLLNSVSGGNGAVLNVASGATVTIGTSATAAFLENASITAGGVAQGLARIVTNSPAVACSAAGLDATLTPPTALAGLAVMGCNELPALPVCGGQPLTPTATASRSSTPSNTPTRTNTTTRTATRTPTRTPTPTPTRTPTASPTQGAINTATTTRTPTRTATSSPTATPSRSPTRTPTPLATPSSSPTASPTQAAVNTATPTRTPTRTATSSPTSTRSGSPTRTPTSSPSVTPSLSASPTRTTTSTATTMFTPTRTPTSSPVSTPSRSPSRTPTYSPSWSPTRSPTETPFSTFTGTTVSTRTPTLPSTSSPSNSPTRTNTSSPLATSSATPSLTASPSASVSPSPTTSSTRTPTMTPSVSPSRSATVTFTPAPTATFVTSLSPTSAPSASPPSTPTFTSVVPATPTQTAASTSSPTSVPTSTPPLATATSLPTTPGDANCDGAVKAADVSALAALYATASRADCGDDDANGNGTIDSGDFQALIIRIFSDE